MFLIPHHNFIAHTTADKNDIKVVNADAWKKIGVSSSAGSGIGSGSTSSEGRDATPDLWTSAASEIEADKQREIDRKADVSTVNDAICP